MMMPETKKPWLTLNRVCISVAVTLAATTAALSLPSWVEKRNQAVQNAIVAQEIQAAELRKYPAQLALTSIDAKPDFRILGSLRGLHGNFVFTHASNLTTSVLQRLDIARDGKSRVRSWQFPDYKANDVSAVVHPLFGRDAEHGWIRAMVSGSDVARYRLYAFDLKAQTALLETELFDGRFLVSPDGKHYAYGISDPYSGNYYNLNVVIDKKSRIVSQDLSSDDFTWTPNGLLMYSMKPKTDNPFYYPDIYIDDLKGYRKVVKEGSARGVLSPDGVHLACYEADRTAKIEMENANIAGETRNYQGLDKTYAVIVVYNRETKRSTGVKTVRPHEIHDRDFPKLLWSRDGRILYVIETVYNARLKTNQCEVWAFDVATQSKRLLCRLQQNGEPISANSENWYLPRFEALKIANGTQLLVQISTYRNQAPFRKIIAAVNLNTGQQRDLLAVRETDVDWLDARGRQKNAVQVLADTFVPNFGSAN